MLEGRSVYLGYRAGIEAMNRCQRRLAVGDCQALEAWNARLLVVRLELEEIKGLFLAEAQVGLGDGWPIGHH